MKAANFSSYRKDNLQSIIGVINIVKSIFDKTVWNIQQHTNHLNINSQFLLIFTANYWTFIWD
jgi:hypothetical protein